MKIKHFFDKTSIRDFCHKKTIMNQSGIEKISKNNIFSKHKLYETGRSMVEILGVLAVIGVLSVGGIMGYRFAMDKYRANDIVNEVNLRSTDIWNRYQEMPLPDPSEDPDLSDFPEYAKFTSTGFPIDVTSHPDVAFRVHVFDVPSGVCKQVLNMPLINVIKGLQYIQVNDVKYEDTTQICGTDQTDNVMVFTSFLDSENDLGNGNHCIEDSECTSACGIATCNDETMTCTDGCTGNTDGKNICLQSTGQCVECLVNEDCKSKGQGYICPETTHECEKMQKTCPDRTFRTRNGACVACDDGSNFFVYKNGEPYPESSDETDGYTMCQACDPTRKFGDSLDDPNIGYCSYMCTMGISYQTQDGRCVSCADMSENRITNESVSKAQCLACPNHIWFTDYGNMYCGPNTVCTDGKFKAMTGDNGPYVCHDCTLNLSKKFTWTTGSSNPNFVQEMYDSCNNCPEYVDGVWAKRKVKGNWCFPVCKQPESGSEADTICQEHPESPKCERQWQRANGPCYPCNYTSTGWAPYTIVLDGKVDEELADLCEKCGRRVNSTGNCLPKTSSCKDNQFLGADGRCYSCDYNNTVAVESEELSGCESKCGGANSNLVAGREIIQNKNTKKLYCAPKCKKTNEEGEQLFLSYDGCLLCTSTASPANLNNFDKLKESCLSCNSGGEIVRQYVNGGERCEIATCPTVNGVKQWHQRFGGCKSCNDPISDYCHWDQRNPTTGQFSPVSQQHIDECEACGNRIYLNKDTAKGAEYCALINPGVSGVCNSIETTLPAEATAEIRTKSAPYLRGDYDGKYYRDVQGYCRSCDGDASYSATQAQCNSCWNRRYENSKCLKGLCEAGQTFLNKNSTCVACSNKNVTIDPNKENLCGSCANRRQLETGSSEAGNWAAKCVEVCAGEQWQDATGKCMLCGEGADREIGTDAESRRLCNQCENREAVEKTDTDGHIIGYRCEVVM